MWPSENPIFAIAVCLIVGGVLGAVWMSNRKAVYFVGVVISVLLAIGAYACDHLIVTPKEQVVENVYGITKAFQQRRLNDVYSYISDSAWDVKLLAAQGYNIVQVQDGMRVTDVQVKLIAQDQRAESRFRVNGNFTGPLGGGRFSTMWDGKWEREENEWKLITIKALDPITGEPYGLIEAYREKALKDYPRN